MRPVYLDHNATTPISAEARDAMAPYLAGQFGNPLTSHRFGAGPRAAVDDARREVAHLLGADESSQIIFNSGASEGLNHALKGVAFARRQDTKRRRIVISAIEHYAVLKAALWLADRFDYEVHAVPPESDGVVSAERFLDAVDADTTVVAALHFANNEIGTIQPIEDVGAGCRERSVPFVCDVVQGIGKTDVRAAARAADLVALSAHKFYGPKGVGALLIGDGVECDALVHGAQQEHGKRGGTHNVLGIAGLGAAAAAAARDAEREGPRLAGLRDRLWQDVESNIDGVHWNGGDAPLLPNTLNISLDGCPAHVLCEEMDRRGFAISSGSSCSSGSVEPSRVLTAMGLEASRATTSVRISLGHDTTAVDVSSAAEALAECATLLRRSL